MPISFEKRETQAYCKRICDSNRATAPNHKYKFDEYSLSDDDCTNLHSMAQKDAMGFYYNAILSFSQACHSLKADSISWACIELYYSLFYSVRAYLYYKDYVLIRDNSLYLLKIEKGAKPHSKNNKKYNTDHGGTLNHYIDLYKDSDYLCSNSIDGDFVYLWMMDLRESTNYRQCHFLEPDYFTELDTMVKYLKKAGIAKVLEEVQVDWATYCFSPNYAWFCVPYYKLLETAELYKDCGLQLSDQQKRFLKESLTRLGIKETEIKALF